jgi:ribose transport system ATP-binding protein
MAMLTESRRDDGLFLQDSIDANLTVVAAPQFAVKGWGWLRQSTLEDASERMIRAVNLKGGVDRDQPVRTLSGGNQQKVVLGKWLLNEPSVLILDEPTRGIDVGAKYEIYVLIDRLAASGAGVLVISSEIDELTGICDRILVMSQGEIRDQLNRDEFDRERILHAALHSSRISGEEA